MTHSLRIRGVALGLAAMSTLACTMQGQDPPPLSGPSEFSTSLNIAVTPDILQQDGASQSVVSVTARGPNGAPVGGLPLRAEIYVGGTLADFGSLSSRNLVTGSDGRALLTYTSPVSLPFAVDSYTIVDIGITPIGTDYDNAATRWGSLRLVPRGAIVPPANLQASFVVAPESPVDHQDVFFDASASQAPANNPIATYRWTFGDGDSGSGRTTTHDYSSPGTYVVRLTIADAYGRTAEATRTLNVSPGVLPTARFVISPTTPRINVQVNVNASASVPAPGGTIVSYDWDFGDGTPHEGGVQSAHTFTRAGTYTITLVVTDNAGRRGISSQTVTVGS